MLPTETKVYDPAIYAAHIRDMRELALNSLDRDSDGKLIPEDFDEYMSSPNFSEKVKKEFKDFIFKDKGTCDKSQEGLEIIGWFLQADKNRDGKISIDEAVEHFKMLESLVGPMIHTKEQLIIRIRAFDDDNDGYLNFEQFAKLTK